MAFLDYLASNPIASSFAIFICIVFGYTIYNFFLHPLASVSGHPLAKISSLWLYYHTYIGDEATAIHALHKKYNSTLLRVAPLTPYTRKAEASPSLHVTRTSTSMRTRRSSRRQTALTVHPEQKLWCQCFRLPAYEEIVQYCMTAWIVW
jgi:hypothetical protein